ncbi:ORF300 [Staphylococcus phage Twort]|uniref:ORF300 n=1 Tax=Staphylococcus phage Twort (strain DSM 17442 / HER 48) TaxID=2908167 RepID=Q4Z914_BPTWO|nr:ORF300 [Staphylococcus phage Twort]AAX92480.1 ORF300 [Staphylococcus phage Twort]
MTLSGLQVQAIHKDKSYITVLMYIKQQQLVLVVTHNQYIHRV